MLILWGCALVLIGSAFAAKVPTSYNVVWTTPSTNSSASMPVGGYDMGLNLWVENNTILFYIGKSGTFDENNAMLKLGRVRLTLDPNPFIGAKDFKQELMLQQGYAQVSVSGTTINVWVDVHNPVINIEVSSNKKTSITAAYESWRFEDHPEVIAERDSGDWETIKGVNVTTYKDTIAYDNDRVLLYHSNRPETVFDYSVKLQGLEKWKSQLYNPNKSRVFGGYMTGSNMKPGSMTSGVYASSPYKGWTLQSAAASTSHTLQLVTHVNQTTSFLEELYAISTNGNHNDTQAWWSEFWDRSYINVAPNASPSDIPFQIGRNYQNFRYQMGCNTKGDWPTRFNGGLFTFDPVYVDPTTPFTPDYRKWTGGAFTSQNQRLLSWPLLKSGVVRGMAYWGINASYLTEQIDNCGLPNPTEYNSDEHIFNRTRPANFPQGVQWNDWLAYLWDTALEFALQMLDAKQFFGMDVRPYLPFIENTLRFYDMFYQQQEAERYTYALSQSKQLVIYPGAGAETYKAAYNPASTIGALKTVTTRLLVNNEFAVANASYYEGFLSRIPDIPLRVINGYTMIAPAQAYGYIQNVEMPQLYPVFPWGIYGLGKANLSYAINAYEHDPEIQEFKSYVGWKQDNIFTARMGLTSQAKNYTSHKLADSTSNRFPSFWGPGFDWSPDHNWGGSGMIGLQEMLMQTDNKTIRLVPAWPSDWDVDFKLNAPYNTTVEASVRGGKVTSLTVKPGSRAKDVIYGQHGTTST